MKSKSRAGIIVFIILFAILGFEAFNFFGGFDYIKASQFTPSGEMQGIIDELNLTDRGNRIFRAVSPNLASRSTFNEKCNSHNSEVYVLGCYITGDDAIYLYDVDVAELDGVKESTAAHELLHAVYNRLPFWEKNSLNEKLRKVYDSLDETSDVKNSMELYSDNEFYDELHSRIGTEIKNLPTELEGHYAAIFKDQDKIVDFYDKYSGTFKKLEKEVEELSKKIEEGKRYIDEETARLDSVSKELNAKISDYNNRVGSGSYSAALVTEGNNLQKEISRVEEAYKKLNEYINEYNKLVDEYNNNVIQTNNILDSINSNSSKVEEVK